MAQYQKTRFHIYGVGNNIIHPHCFRVRNYQLHQKHNTKLMKMAHKTAIAIVWVMSIVVFALLFSYANHLLVEPIKIIGRNEIYPSVVERGSAFAVCRDMLFNKSGEYHVTHFLSRKTSGDSFDRHEFSNIIAIRKKGEEAHQCRWFEMPRTIPAGKWTLESSVLFTSWPWWKGVYKMPPISIEVI